MAKLELQAASTIWFETGAFRIEFRRSSGEFWSRSAEHSSLTFFDSAS
jgi:hypothetical protein